MFKRHRRGRFALRSTGCLEIKAMRAMSIVILIAGLVVAGCNSPSANTDVSAFVPDDDQGVRPWTGASFDAGDGKFTFAVFADLTGGERSRVFDIAIAQLNLLRPELIMNVGDLIEGDSGDRAGLSAEWSTFDARAGKARARMFYAGGNHDLTGALLRQVWEERFGRRYYHFVYKNVLFLVLDTEDNTPQRMEEIYTLRKEALAVLASEGREAAEKTRYAALPERSAGTIGPEQSSYFQEVIEANGDVRWTFVFLHKPAWQKEGETTFAAIEAALSDRPYTVFSGHVHAFGYEERFGRDYIRLATTGGSQYSTETRSVDHITLVTVSDSEVDVANLLLSGILDKKGQVPLGGDELCFEMPLCGK